MLLPTDLIDELNSFTLPHIEYHILHKKYRLNTMWVDDIEINYFNSVINVMIDSLKTILISSNNNLLIVDQIKDILEDKIAWFRLNQIQNFNSFSKIEHLISNVNYEIDYDCHEIYTIESVLNFKSIPDKIEDLLLYALIAHTGSTNNYEKSKEFENVKLHFIINQYFKSLNYFIEQIDKIKTAIQVYGVSDLTNFISKTEIPNDKCTVKLDKLSSTFLFRFLLENDFIYMDSNSGKNETKIKKFVEKNFNFTEANGQIKPLNGLTIEYSKLKGGGRKTKQLEVIDKLIKALEKQKNFVNKY